MDQEINRAEAFAAFDSARKAFEDLERIFGRKKARQAWGLILRDALKRTVKPAKKRGPKGGPRKPERAAFLLSAYDRVTPAEYPNLRKLAPRRIGEIFNSKAPGKYGQSAESIAKDIRRLLRQRRKTNQDEMIRQLVRLRVAPGTSCELRSKPHVSKRDAGDKIL